LEPFSCSSTTFYAREYRIKRLRQRLTIANLREALSAGRPVARRQHPPKDALSLRAQRGQQIAADAAGSGRTHPRGGGGKRRRPRGSPGG
jgi:hypothetical protein